MKKTFLFALTFIIASLPCHGALKWWEQDTICRLDPSNCYPSMGIGYEPEFWDKTSECWGQKIICANAMPQGSKQNTAMTKKDIAARNNISSDYDINTLNGDCFGVRKTSSNGAFATYNGKSVKVFCPGILENIYDTDKTETLTTGSILLRDTEPTCQELKKYEYINVKNDRCHGKKYAESKYYIDCNGDTPRLIIHNGADYDAPQGTAPKTMNDAEKIFDLMRSRAQQLRSS